MGISLFVEAEIDLGTHVLKQIAGHEDHVGMIPYDDLDSDVQREPSSPSELPEQLPQPPLVLTETLVK